VNWRKLAEWFGLAALSLAAVFVVLAGTMLTDVGLILVTASAVGVAVGITAVFVATREPRP
jgi:hypothetical protein